MSAHKYIHKFYAWYIYHAHTISAAAYIQIIYNTQTIYLLLIKQRVRNYLPLPATVALSPALAAVRCTTSPARLPVLTLPPMKHMKVA